MESRRVAEERLGVARERDSVRVRGTSPKTLVHTAAQDQQVARRIQVGTREAQLQKQLQYAPERIEELLGRVSREVGFIGADRAWNLCRIYKRGEQNIETRQKAIALIAKAEREGLISID